MGQLFNGLSKIGRRKRKFKNIRRWRPPRKQLRKRFNPLLKIKLRKKPQIRALNAQNEGVIYKKVSNTHRNSFDQLKKNLDKFAHIGTLIGTLKTSLSNLVALSSHFLRINIDLLVPDED